LKIKNKKVPLWKQMLPGALTILFIFLEGTLSVLKYLDIIIFAILSSATIIIGFIWMTNVQEKERLYKLEQMDRRRKRIEKLRDAGAKI